MLDAPNGPLPSGQEINLWFEAFKILITSALSILGTGVLVGLWQLREKYIDERVSELIKEVDSAASLAIEYWSLSPSTRARHFREVFVHDIMKDRALEAELLAKVLRVGRMRAAVGEFLDKNKMMALFEEEGHLNSALTGGDFKSPNRVCEQERFDLVRGHAATYIGLILQARHARLSQPWYKRIRH